MRTLGYELKNNRVTVREYDKTSNEYLDFLVESNQIESFIDIAVNIDSLYELEDGALLWEDLGLENARDYIGMCKFLIGMDLKDEFIRAMKMTISSIQNSTFRTYEDYEKAIEEEVKNKKEELEKLNNKEEV